MARKREPGALGAGDKVAMISDVVPISTPLGDPSVCMQPESKKILRCIVVVKTKHRTGAVPWETYDYLPSSASERKDFTEARIEPRT